MDKSILDYTEVTQVADDDYILFDSESGGTSKILASYFRGEEPPEPNYNWYYNQDKTLVVREKISDGSFRWYFDDYNIQGFDSVPVNLQRFILNGVGARAGIGNEPGVVGFYDDTIRGWTPTLGYNMTGITKGIVESTDVGIDYDNYHEWEEPTFDPING